MQVSSRLYFDAAGNLVPAPQLVKGDAEAISDGNQRVPAASGVEQGVERRGGNRRDRYYQCFNTRNALVCVQLVGGRQLGDSDVIGVCHRCKRVIRVYAVIA